jgi:outer membrane protein TolC
MRIHKHFGARVVRTACAAGLFLSVFGPLPVRAQTALTPAAAAASGQAAPGQVRRLSMDEAVAQALENNLDLQVDRINPQLQDLSVAQVASGYTPTFQSNLNFADQTSQPTDFLSGNVTQLTGNNSNYNFGIGSLTKWGATYSAGWNNRRATTNNLQTTFNPQINSTLNLNYTQPLLRNFKIDGTRQQLLVSQRNLEITDVQLQQSIAVTARNVKNAYYDLVYAIDNLKVQRQSLELAQQSLKNNRARVEIGTMAPIDIVQAEAEVAQREEGVILAEATISRAEDRLRALVFNPTIPDFWTMRIEPSDTVLFKAVQVDTEGAVRNALDKRTDLVTSRKQIETNDITIRYFRNQTLPDVNASLNYFASSLGGTGIVRDGPFGPILRTAEKSYVDTLGTLFVGDFPTWTAQVQINYPIGRSNAEASLARARLQDTQSKRQLQSQELQIATQIRDYARAVETNAKRVDATRASRTFAERRLEAEEKKFQAGMTDSFQVFQAQRDLNQARNSELQAQIDYAKSVVDYETSQVVPLAGGGGVTPVSTAGGTGGR